MNRFFPFLSTYRLAQLSLDAIAASFALVLAFVIRFEGRIPNSYHHFIIWLLIFTVFSRLLLQGAFGVYRQIWRLFSQRDFWSIVQAVSFYSLISLFMLRLFCLASRKSPRYPWVWLS